MVVEQAELDDDGGVDSEAMMMMMMMVYNIQDITSFVFRRCCCSKLLYTHTEDNTRNVARDRIQLHKVGVVR